MDPSSQEESDLIKEMQDKCRFKKSPNNNNEEDFESVYAEAACDGRISGASNESAFSSGAGSEEIENNSTLSDNNSSSGRSSSNRENQSLEFDHKILNPYCNLVPETKEANELVNQVRLKFLDSLKDISNVYELYDKLDIDELKKPLPPPDKQEQSLGFRLISRYLRFHHLEDNNNNSNDKKREKDINSAVDGLKDFLLLRKNYNLSSCAEEHFSKEFYILSGALQFGYDKNHTPVLHLRAHVHRKWSIKFDDTFRRFVAWQLNVITKSNHGAGEIKKFNPYNTIECDGSFGICFDCINVSYSCLDMDFLRFLVRLLVHYYPTYCRYAICVDLPWLFRSVWKLVRSWLPEEAQKTVQLITSKELIEYIDEDQIPNSIRFNDKKASEKPIKNKHPLPKNWDSIKGIEEFADELNISSSELKQFKSHVEKVMQEYIQLGAL